jgi:hypothetical protein
MHPSAAPDRRHPTARPRAGAIQSVRIGACRRIPAAAIVDYIERPRREAAA